MQIKKLVSFPGFSHKNNSAKAGEKGLVYTFVHASGFHTFPWIFLLFIISQWLIGSKMAKSPFFPLLNSLMLLHILSYEISMTSTTTPPSPCDSRLLGVFHASTPKHSTDAIIWSLMGPCGVVLIVFAWERVWIYMKRTVSFLLTLN